MPLVKIAAIGVLVAEVLLSQGSEDGRVMPAAPTPPTDCRACWHPPLRIEWQWQLGGRLSTKPMAQLYDVDMFETPSSQVRRLHELGRRVVCYVDAGSWEGWRPDAGRFPKSVLGNPVAGWPDERWLDVRKLSVLRPILESRVDLCRKKGFDGIEFDNVDGYTNPTGFPLSFSDQLRFNIWLAHLAHQHRLAVALKNDPDQVARLLPYFDFALVEQCFQFTECGAFVPFVRARKPVLEVEYALPKSRFCRRANAMNFNAMKKRLALGVWRSPCR